MSRFAHDFLVPLVEPPSRSPSVVTVASHSGHSEVSTGSLAVAFEPLVGQHAVPKETRELLRKQLMEWREKERADDPRDLLFLSPAVDFSDKTIEKLVEECARFLTIDEVTPRDILKVVKWDGSKLRDREDVAHIISLWRVDAVLSATPKSRSRKRKKARTMVPTAGRATSFLDAENNVSPSPSPRPGRSPDATPWAQVPPAPALFCSPMPQSTPASPTPSHRNTTNTPVFPRARPLGSTPGALVTPPPTQMRTTAFLPAQPTAGHSYMQPGIGVTPGYAALPYSPLPMRVITPPPSQMRAPPLPFSVPSPNPSPMPVFVMPYPPGYYPYPPYQPQ